MITAQKHFNENTSMLYRLIWPLLWFTRGQFIDTLLIFSKTLNEDLIRHHAILQTWDDWCRSTDRSRLTQLVDRHASNKLQIVNTSLPLPFFASAFDAERSSDVVFVLCFGTASLLSLFPGFELCCNLSATPCHGSHKSHHNCQLSLHQA